WQVCGWPRHGHPFPTRRSSDRSSPRIAPDGRSVAVLRSYDGEPGGEPRSAALRLIDLETGEQRDPLPGSEAWPREFAWAADSAALYFTADDSGRAPVFRVDLATSDRKS